MTFTKKQKLYIKEQILQDIFDYNVRVYGPDRAAQIKDMGIQVRVSWYKGYKRNSEDVTKPLHLNYIIPYDWRINPHYTNIDGYNEWSYYYMSTLDYERNNKLEELFS